MGRERVRAGPERDSEARDSGAREREWAREGESSERVGRESENGTRERVRVGVRERDEKGQ